MTDHVAHGANPGPDMILRTTWWRGDEPTAGDYIYQDGSRADPRRLFRVKAVSRDEWWALVITCEQTDEWAPWAKDPGTPTVFHWDWRIIGAASWSLTVKAS